MMLFATPQAKKIILTMTAQTQITTLFLLLCSPFTKALHISFHASRSTISSSPRQRITQRDVILPRPRKFRSSLLRAAANENASSDVTNSNAPCQVLLLDHININHQKGHHSLLKSFYFHFLQCSIDPRKYENYTAGKKTIWANIGMHQFHLPEGKPDAQVLDGKITLVYENLHALQKRYHEYLNGENPELDVLKGTKFDVRDIIIADDKNNGEEDMILVSDPWGNQFQIMSSSNPTSDRAANIGSQPLMENDSPSEGLALKDLTVHVAHGANLGGISRFYETVLGAPTVASSDSHVSIAMDGQRGQTLTFRYHHDGPSAVEVKHHDFCYDNKEGEGDETVPFYPSNQGPHISLYITNLRHAYQSASELGVLYVNPRFKRRAYTEEEAIDQCMFRIIDIVDPLDDKREVIVRLEHEVRAVVTREGKKYKSCPLFEIPR